MSGSRDGPRGLLAERPRPLVGAIRIVVLAALSVAVFTAGLVATVLLVTD